MWKKIKNFCSLIKYETIRITRNKAVTIMLFVFSVVLLIALSIILNCTTSYPIAIYTDGLEMEDISFMEIIDKTISTDKVIYVDSEEEGLELMRRCEVCFFIRVHAGENGDGTVASLYTDQTSQMGRSISSWVSDVKNQYAYNALLDFLSDYGIKLNQTHFDLIQFERSNIEPVDFMQMPFAIEVVCCTALILVLGMAYSLARDNETQVSRNTAYIPIGINRYLLSKIVPFFILGMLEVSAMYLIGNLFFHIQFQTNMFYVILLSAFFILAVIMLSLLFSLCKNQISAVFLNMLTIMLPLFVVVSIYIQAAPIFVQILLNCFPIIPFITFLNCMIFNGVIIWWYIPLFIVQVIVYYLVAVMILKNRLKD